MLEVRSLLHQGDRLPNCIQPWITPSIFENTGNDAIVDEYTFGQLQDQQDAERVLENHWQTWIVEDDFRQMKAAGLNHVRYDLTNTASSSLCHATYVSQDPLGLLVNTPHVRGHQTLHRRIALRIRGMVILCASPRLG